MSEDAIARFKEAQRQGWKHFAPLEAMTTPVAARLVKFARVRAGQKVLDVACGTGVVAITAARLGAQVNGIDLTPELLERAGHNAHVANVAIDFREADAEVLPFADAAFDVVLSQFGHMFAPRPALALAQMLRVLKPGGTIAFVTWPPELLVGSSFRLVSSYSPAPPPPGASPPPQWGDVNTVRERLGPAVNDIVFDRACMLVPALSVQNYRDQIERTAGPMLKLVEALSSDPARLAEFRREYDALVAPYFEDNLVRQDYLLTRAVKA